MQFLQPVYTISKLSMAKLMKKMNFIVGGQVSSAFKALFNTLALVYLI